MQSPTSRERSRRASSRGLRTPGRTLAVLCSRRLVADAIVWFCAMSVGALTLGASASHATFVGAVSAAAQVVGGLLSGLYLGKWRMGSFDEVVVLGVLSTIVATSLGVARFLSQSVGLTLAISGLAPFAALTGMLLARGLQRARRERNVRPDAAGMTPVIVFGAGEGGAQLIRSMLVNPASRYLPVALIDDDPSKANLRIQGVPVRGRRSEIANLAADVRADLLIVAIPSAESDVVLEICEIAEHAGIDVRILPPTVELVEGVASLSDVREVTEADLLGRRAIDTDVEAIAGYLTGKRVLVTGAGGSIGSELCRQIQRFGPATLVILDRDESALHAVQLSLYGRALIDDRSLVVADIRDSQRLDDVFGEHTPEVVFHAAALKHLPLLEMYPEEGWKTNVEGTNNVLRAAAKVGVNRFVNVSTDKAADPTSVLGFSKRLAEQLTAWYANRTRGDWVSVRFGNVLGSRGSVLEVFRTQIASGGPITVTDPDVTRFFMMPVEACQLVIQAGAVGIRGEALVLDMGKPVRILDVAERLVAHAAHPVEIEFTGLRPGEKLHESLVSVGELDIRRSHPLISHVPVPAMSPTQLGLFNRSTHLSARASMEHLCSDVAPHT